MSLLILSIQRIFLKHFAFVSTKEQFAFVQAEKKYSFGKKFRQKSEYMYSICNRQLQKGIK